MRQDTGARNRADQRFNERTADSGSYRVSDRYGAVVCSVRGVSERGAGCVLPRGDLERSTTQVNDVI
ncbi:MAG: hypothetical protein RH980_01535, partial [Roseovarius confluentis]